MFSFSLGSPHFVHGNFYKIKHYITEVEKQNKFYEKRTVQNLYTSMTEECISITSSLQGRQAVQYDIN